MIYSAKDIEYDSLEFTWGIKGTLFKSYGNNFFSRQTEICPVTPIV